MLFRFLFANDACSCERPALPILDFPGVCTLEIVMQKIEKFVGGSLKRSWFLCERCLYMVMLSPVVLSCKSFDMWDLSSWTRPWVFSPFLVLCAMRMDRLWHGQKDRSLPNTDSLLLHASLRLAEESHSQAEWERVFFSILFWTKILFSYPHTSAFPNNLQGDKNKEGMKQKTGAKGHIGLRQWLGCVSAICQCFLVSRAIWMQFDQWCPANGHSDVYIVEGLFETKESPTERKTWSWSQRAAVRNMKGGMSEGAVGSCPCLVHVPRGWTLKWHVVQTYSHLFRAAKLSAANHMCIQFLLLCKRSYPVQQLCQKVHRITLVQPGILVSTSPVFPVWEQLTGSFMPYVSKRTREVWVAVWVPLSTWCRWCVPLPLSDSPAHFALLRRVDIHLMWSESVTVMLWAKPPVRFSAQHIPCSSTGPSAEWGTAPSGCGCLCNRTKWAVLMVLVRS